MSKHFNKTDTGKGGTPLPNTKMKKPGRNEQLVKGGPGNVEGVAKPTEKTSLKNEKKSSSDINTFNMSNSLFEKLFEDIMSGDDQAAENELLDIGGDEGGEDFGGEEGGDEVTLTMDRATAEKLHELLGSVLGGGMEEEEEGEEFGEGEDFGDEDMDQDEDFGGGEDDTLNDSVEIQAEPKELKNDGKIMQKGMTVTASGYKATTGKASIGKGPAIDTGSAFTKKAATMQNKNNKVQNSRKPGDNLF